MSKERRYKTMSKYEIEYINSCGHIIHNFIIETKTEKQAIQAAKKGRFLYPDCAWIEIINLNEYKRIYA